METLWDILRAQPETSRMRQIVAAANAEKLFTLPANITLLAPTNQGLRVLGTDTLNYLFEDSAAARHFVGRHTIAGEVSAASLLDQSRHLTLTGHTLDVVMREGPRIENARFVDVDLRANHRLLHLLDRPALPRTAWRGLVRTAQAWRDGPHAGPRNENVTSASQAAQDERPDGVDFFSFDGSPGNYRIYIPGHSLGEVPQRVTTFDRSRPQAYNYRVVTS